jgi:hypothetical protein
MPKDIDFKEVDLIYNGYMRVMQCMHEKVRVLYNSYVQKYLDEKQRSQYKVEYPE